MTDLDCGDLWIEDAGRLGVNILAKGSRRQLCFVNNKGAEALRLWLEQRALGDNARSAEATLRVASDLFHQILSALAAQRLLSSGKVLTEPMRVEFTKRVIEPAAIEKIAADGFEACLLALRTLGAEDVMIHECTPEEHW